MKRNSQLLIALMLVVGGAISYFTFNASQAHQVDFNRDIRPILNNNCLGCHGGVKKSGGFSMLFKEEAFQENDSGIPAIIPGDPENSELIIRALHTDPEMRMPLDADPLKPEEIKLLSRWIAAGAPWEDHWAFVPVVAPEIPSLSWGNNTLDKFVGQKLREEGLKPSPQADKSTLLRRVSLDLIGLPPTLQAVQSFVEDERPEAYEAYVDSLLKSPAFGERWAAMWMDLARYGDSQGYQKDRARNIWRYRDWVIKAFNEDMPFDQFTIEQLAGDLLPNSTQPQQIATAFHRNTMSNDEGGTDDEEFRVAAVIDRINTTFEVWQGLTIGCVQCHSHPYDPIVHKEYYELYAFFNNSADADRSDDFPTLLTFSPRDSVEIVEIKDWLKAHEGKQDMATRVATRKKQRTLRQKYFHASTPVMQELPPDSSRKTHLFERGNWLVHGEEVFPGVPASLSDFPEGAPRNRLGLAQWLVAPENPLTARVIVNRFWEQIFGIGLVETLEDFGSQGNKPANQVLLDHLAHEFVHTHQWHVKALLKDIVMSATYQQRSAVSDQLVQRDPYNRLLARGPRVRLSAEQIRDQALAVSGLLSDKMYGPSVMPPQPEGVWNVIRHVMRWESAKGEDRYRRGLYTYLRRSSPYPSMIAFDGPSREFCVSRRIRTNTPLQALVSLNDTVYMETAQALAKRMQEAPVETLEDQLAYGYSLAMLRPPTSATLKDLHAYTTQSLEHYQTQPEDVTQLMTMYPDADAQLAALTTAANVILNLDEFIVKD